MLVEIGNFAELLANEIAPFQELVFLYPSLCETRPAVLSHDFHLKESMIDLALSYLLS